MLSFLASPGWVSLSSAILYYLQELAGVIKLVSANQARLGHLEGAGLATLGPGLPFKASP
jgi:hypothetical protein